MNSQCFCSCSGKDYLVRVKYQQNKRFVRIPKDELNLTAFLDRGSYGNWRIFFLNKTIFKWISASKELKIDHSEGLQIRLIDNESTPIHPEMFGEIVQNFWNGSGFYIQLLVENDFDAAKSGVTPDVSLRALERHDCYLLLRFFSSDLGKILDRQKCRTSFSRE